MLRDEIYIDYNDYPVLSEEFTKTELGDLVSTKLSTYNLGWLTSDTTLANKIKALTLAFISPIYDEYYSDRLAYEDSDTFVDRMINSLCRKVNRWYAQKQIEEDLISNATLEKFISNGGTHSETSENAQTGSAVIQKSASTPTGITHSESGELIDMEVSHNETTDKTRLDIDDNYEDKYTNFVGKTNGLHRNEVDRDTDIKRTSNYGLALEILDKIPYSYINDVLREVSQHFIQVY